MSTNRKKIDAAREWVATGGMHKADAIIISQLADALEAAESPSTPVAGERHCGRGSCAAMEGHEGTCAEASGWAVDGEPEREALGEVLARAGEYDYCHERVREWEAQPDWEKEAHPENEPHTDREDAEFWNVRADVAIAAGYRREPESPTTVEWGVRAEVSGAVCYWGPFNQLAESDPKDYPGFTIVTRNIGPWEAAK